MMGSSPVKNTEDAYSQKKIKLKTNPKDKTDIMNVGYDADIDDMRMAKTIKSLDKEIQTEGSYHGGYRSDALGYKGKELSAAMTGKGIYKEKYNVGEYGSIDKGTDLSISQNITRQSGTPVKPINIFVEEKAKKLKYKK